MYTLVATLQRTIGFFGMAGPLWFFIGLVLLIAFCAIVWRLTGALGAAVGVSAPWMQVIYWLFVLFCFVLFVNYAGAHWW